MAARKKARKSPQAFKPSFEEKEGGPMGRAEDMRNLCQDIVNSFDARVARVASLKQETAEMMKGFQRENQQRTREVGNMLAGFRREQEAMAGHWRNMAATMERKRAGKH